MCIIYIYSTTVWNLKPAGKYDLLTEKPVFLLNNVDEEEHFEMLS